MVEGLGTSLRRHKDPVVRHRICLLLRAGFLGLKAGPAATVSPAPETGPGKSWRGQAAARRAGESVHRGLTDGETPKMHEQDSFSGLIVHRYQARKSRYLGARK